MDMIKGAAQLADLVAARSADVEARPEAAAPVDERAQPIFRWLGIQPPEPAAAYGD
jgi:hypothetical protein